MSEQKGEYKVEVKRLDEAVTPDPNNVNKHTQRGQTLVENSLRRRGAFRGIAAAGKNAETPVVYAGNLTLEQAAAAGFEEVILVHTDGRQLVVTVRDDVEPGSPEAIALGLEDNESAKQSYNPDVDVLAALAAGNEAVLSAFKEEDKIFGGMLENIINPSSHYVPDTMKIKPVTQEDIIRTTNAGFYPDGSKVRIEVICPNCATRFEVDKTASGLGND
jgi:hypothetical protein